VKEEEWKIGIDKVVPRDILAGVVMMTTEVLIEWKKAVTSSTTGCPQMVTRGVVEATVIAAIMLVKLTVEVEIVTVRTIGFRITIREITPVGIVILNIVVDQIALIDTVQTLTASVEALADVVGAFNVEVGAFNVEVEALIVEVKALIVEVEASIEEVKALFVKALLDEARMKEKVLAEMQ